MRKSAVSVVFFYSFICGLALSREPAKVVKSVDDFGLSLVGGSEDPSDMFPSVLVFSLEDKNLDSRCTGTKVGKQTVLTAAHCLLDERPEKKTHGWQLSNKRMYFSFEPRVPQLQVINEVTVRAAYFPPDLLNCFALHSSKISNCIDEAPDIAVIIVDPSNDFNLAPRSTIDTFPVEVGDLATVVGFGQQSETDNSFPVRKFHRFKVASPQELYQAFDISGITDAHPNFELYFGALGAFFGKEYANLGSGDSGGPVFRSRDGYPYVVGVNAFTFCPDKNESCEATSNSFFNRIHRGGRYRLGEWLTSVIK